MIMQANPFLHIALGIIFVLCLTGYALRLSVRGGGANHQSSVRTRRKPLSINNALATRTAPSALPHNLSHCVTLRLGRGINETPLEFGLPQDLTTLTPFLPAKEGARMGFVFVDDPDEFVSLGKPGKFHLFHFLEFLVIAFAEWHALGQQGGRFTLEWIHVPLMTPDEICGVGKGLNCAIINVLFGRGIRRDGSGSRNNFDDDGTQIHGLYSIHNTTRISHPGYRGQLRQRDRHPGASDRLNNSTRWSSQAYDAMVQRVDAIFLVDRPRCKTEQRINIRKIVTNYVGNFPAPTWYQHVRTGLARWQQKDDRGVHSHQPAGKETSVCYIDRQQTSRHMPTEYHEWLLSHIQNHPRLGLMHLHIEQFKPVEQMQLASTCNVILGVHGNGLSHSLWMKPGSFVVEFFWNFHFHYDYASMAQLMRHRYMALVDGEVPEFETDIVKIQNKSQVFVTKQPRIPQRRRDVDFDDKKLDVGRKAVVSFLEDAIVATLSEQSH
mmetsp:Transcript_3205/g.9020  ORF Transcript_3205/g.9020 Transcript_3205/m.9020 type:complete len:494 (-) Transcript_3205:767-2248(-)